MGALDVQVGGDLVNPFPRLFEPAKLGPLTVRNRVMRVATTSNLAVENRVEDRMVEFYRAVAQGGVGSIVTEGLRCHPSEAGPGGAILMWQRAAIPQMRKIADAVHEGGAIAIGQLNHGGRQHLSRAAPPVMIAPSAIACPFSGGIPHELTTREVEELIDWFVISAGHCIEAKLDGVEIHGAQGHLLQQFLSPFSNRRSDRYGGDLEGRSRVSREILRRVRQRIGPNRVLGVRLGVAEFVEGGLTTEETRRFARLLAEDGIADYVSLTQGTFRTIEAHIPDRHYGATPYREIQAEMKSSAGTMAVVMCTKIQTPQQAEDVLAEGSADFAGFCRPFLADPDWPNKARQGQLGAIRRCISCNQCWQSVSEGQAVSCVVNPTAARENDMGRIKPLIGSPRTVLVVGGGPAGLEAARVAALRGQKVILAEAGDRLGGQIVQAAEAPHFGDLALASRYLIDQVHALGVDVRTGTRVDWGMIHEETPDRIVLATGSAPRVPDLPDDGSVAFGTSLAEVASRMSPGATVVLYDSDGYYWPAAMAEALVAARFRVVFVTGFFEPLREVPTVSRITTLRVLDAAGMQIHANTDVTALRGGMAELTHRYSGRTESVPCDALIATGWRSPNDALFHDALPEYRDRMKVVGDAFAPRHLAQAIRDGHSAGSWS